MAAANALPSPSPAARLQGIALARQAVLHRGPGQALAQPCGLAPWIAASWQRCLGLGQRPEQRVVFEPVPAAALRRSAETHRQLVQAARPVLGTLGHAMAHTRYFAILTNAQGIVVDAHGPIDHADPRASLITRTGVDLSERAVGTSAIGAALHEHQPIWLHRGEHFFHDTSIYSCAGAPLFGPTGQCIGMLDLTGIEAAERPELVHLVAQAARSIENALVLELPHALLVHINWPGRALGEADDGLVSLDRDGFLLGSNHAARQMLGSALLHEAAPGPLHASDLFALPYALLFDAARAQRPCLEVPLWSGLRLNAQARLPHHSAQRIDTAPHLPAYPATHSASRSERLPLKDLEVGLIQQAVRDAKGNVAQAAKALGISRATVYRKLAPPSGAEGRLSAARPEKTAAGR